MTEETPAFKDIFIKDVTVNDVGRAIYFNGLPEMPVRNISMENIVLTDAGEGIVLNRAEGVSVKNVKIVTKEGGDNLMMRNVKNVTVNDKTYKEVGGEAKSVAF